jgi:uncharacterized protein (TIGR03067 family)
MRITKFVVPVVFLVMVLDLSAVPVKPAKKQDPARDLKKLEGTWRVISYEKNGLKYSAESLALMPLLTFKGSTYSWSDGGRPGKIVRIDANAKPKTLDYRITAGGDKDKTELGIYEITGDSFRDCFAPDGGQRPKEFNANQGTGQTLVVYERVK